MPDSAIPWTVASQAPLSMEFSRQEHWNGLSFPSPGDVPNPGIKLASPTLQVDSLPTGPPGKPSNIIQSYNLQHVCFLALRYNLHILTSPFPCAVCWNLVTVGCCIMTTNKTQNSCCFAVSWNLSVADLLWPLATTDILFKKHQKHFVSGYSQLTILW